MATAVASWLPFARASAVGWVPLSRCPMPAALPTSLGATSGLATAAMPTSLGAGGLATAAKSAGEKLALNVSGRHYEAWLQTVERFPDTFSVNDMPKGRTKCFPDTCSENNLPKDRRERFPDTFIVNNLSKDRTGRFPDTYSVNNLPKDRTNCFPDTCNENNLPKGRRERFPDTLLGSPEREYFRDADTGEFFFDRDPDLFRHILNYYRTGRIHMPRDVCFTAFVDELAYFGIRADIVADCCHEDYEDRSSNISDVLLSFS